MKARKLAVMVIVAMLVSTALVAPVAASTPDDDDGTGFAGDPCGRDVIGVAVDMLQGNFDKSTECRIEQIRQGNKEQEMQDIHARSATLATSVDSFLDGTHNSLENARTVAWTKAEVATLNALENNSTQAETRVAAREAVRDYYSRMLANVIADQNAKMEEVSYLAEVRQNESLNTTTFYLDVTEITADYQPQSSNFADLNVTIREQYELPNGSTVQVRSLQGRIDWCSAGCEYDYYGTGPISFTNNSWTPNAGWEQLYIRSQYDGETVTVYNGSRWQAIEQEILSQNQQMLDNMNSTVNGLYGSYVRGELDINEYQSVQAAAMDSSQNLDETGYSFYSVVALAQAGATTPDLNTTGSMTISTDEFTANNTTEELTGLVVGDPPDGSGNWTVGDTYNPANGNGTLTFHVEASNRSVVLTEPFNLTGATDKQGDPIAVVEGQEYNYRTNDYEELGEKLDRMIELRQEEQTRIEEAANGGSGGGGIGWPDIGSAAGFALGGGVVMLVLAAVLVGVGVKLYIEVMTP